jgi:hypothetical protein
MMKRVEGFLGLEAAVFATAALVHAGILLNGYQHRQARIAESVIAAVLLVGLTASMLLPRLSRTAGLAAQGFALLGTLVGITMISIGVGPRSVLDIALHISMVTLLVTGLYVAATHREHRFPI